MNQTRRLPLLGIGLLLLAIVGVWSRRRGAMSQGAGRLVAAGGEARSSIGEVLLDILVLSTTGSNRLYEVGWRVLHAHGAQAGDTLLREIMPGQTERYAINALLPRLNPGDELMVRLDLFSRPVSGGNLTHDDAQEFVIKAT